MLEVFLVYEPNAPKIFKEKPMPKYNTKYVPRLRTKRPTAQRPSPAATLDVLRLGSHVQ